MSMSDVDDVKMETVLEEIRNSKSVMTFYRTHKDECKFLHSGLGETDYGTALILLSRHIQVFDFWKLAIVNTEIYREANGMEGFNFTPKALEYMEWKKNNYNQTRQNDIL